jgi:hypothetical protein
MTRRPPGVFDSWRDAVAAFGPWFVVLSFVGLLCYVARWALGQWVAQ